MDRLDFLESFLNSELFIAVVTLLVGTTAFVLYIRQRRDYKSDAALLILQEIRYAEQIFRIGTNAGSINFPLYGKMLPTNNWNKNIHLFLKDLEETELDLISRFYSMSAYIDSLVSKISDDINKPQGAIITNQTSPQNQASVLIPADPMQNTQQLLRTVCNEMEMVYNSPTGEKLKKLARRRPLLIFF